VLEGTALQFTPWRHIGVAGLDYRGYRNKIRQAFNAIEKIETSNRPRFLFAHIMAPHAPFVFDANGLDAVPRYTLSLEDGNSFPGTRDEYVKGYRNQATFIAARLIEVIDHLLSTGRASGRDPVIIVHGDHGPRLEFDTVDAAKTDSSESQPVLLAIRWSNTMRTSPPSVVSLVNVYRAVFDHYFAAGLGRLPDRAWVSSFRYPYKLLEVAVPVE
jgi:hypothetical protein